MFPKDRRGHHKEWCWSILLVSSAGQFCSEVGRVFPGVERWGAGSGTGYNSRLDANTLVMPTPGVCPDPNSLAAHVSSALHHLHKWHWPK